MTKKIIREFPLEIRHYEGDQTKDELYDPCRMCLFCHFYDCLIFGKPIKESRRNCVSNYRIDQETLVDAMRRKLEKDCDEIDKWIKSYNKYMEPDDGKLIVVRSPEDIIRVHEELKKNGEL